MALPEKNYYSLQEISMRWGISLQDIRYYAEHGFLDIQTWLPETVVRLYRDKRTEDGDIAPVPVGVSSYKGYAVIEPDDLRKIFRNGSRPVSKFINPKNNDSLRILDERRKFIVTPEDLVICKCERNWFEENYGLKISTEQIPVAASKMPSFSGRPSVMHRVSVEFDRRCACNEVKTSLRQEAMYLEAWAKENIGDSQTPTAKTIMNVLRPQYQKHVHGRASLSETAIARN